MTDVINQLLDSLGRLEPAIITVKPKLHILLHLPKSIRRFGPAIGFSTELFESFNGVFRLCSIYSNRQSPSRDIAQKFASMGRVKHLVSGGWWLEQNRWNQPGIAVRQFMQQHTFIQKYMGWSYRPRNVPGSAHLPTKKECEHTIEWSGTLAASAFPCFGIEETVRRELESSSFIRCKALVGQHGDTIKKNWFIIAKKVSTSNLSPE